MNLKPTHIEATTLSDAWYQLIYKCIEVGREFIIDEGSYKGQKRLELDHITVHIKSPNIRSLLPQLPSYYNIPNPVDDNYLNDYLPYLMTGELKGGESYTYGSRINKYENEKFSDIYSDEISEEEHPIYKGDVYFWINELLFPYEEIDGSPKHYVNQFEHVIWTYKNKGYRNNQMVLRISEPSDIILKDPPCLILIDTRIQDNKLHFFPYFRSWDLWSGFPANLAAIQVMKEYMASEIGVEDGDIIASSKGLHLYDYCFELGEILRGKTIREFRNESKV